MSTLRKVSSSLLVTLAMLVGTLTLMAFYASTLLGSATTTLQHTATSQIISSLAASDPALAAPALSQQLNTTTSHLTPALATQLGSQDPALAAALTAHPPTLSLATSSTKLHSRLAAWIRWGLALVAMAVALALLIAPKRAVVCRRIGRRTLYFGVCGLLLAWLVPVLLSHLSKASWWTTATSHLNHLVGLAAMAASYLITWREPLPRTLGPDQPPAPAE
jgi:hypothetical protein